MASIRNSLIRSIEDNLEAGMTVFGMDALLRQTYPGVPLEAFDSVLVSDKLLSAMRAVEIRCGIHFVPLTSYYFKHHSDALPETEAEAGRCVAGVVPRMGSTVGFKVPEKDLITKVWERHSRNSAVAHAQTAMAASIQIAAKLGWESPRNKLSKELIQLTNEH